MNNKLLKYLLLTGVVLVWGIIIYKITKNINEDSSTNQSTIPNKKTPEQVTKNDEFILIANYRDPFFENNITEANTQQQAIITEKQIDKIPFIQKQKPILNTNIKFYGMIQNKTTKKKVAVISVNGVDDMVQEKQKLGDILIKKINQHEIIVTYKHENFFIPKI